MKLLQVWPLLLLALDVLHSLPADPAGGVSEDTLRQLSVDGEKLVDEEVKRGLYGVRQVKEAMWRNQQKHEHLMKSLRVSADKKKGAAQLAREVTDKLQEAEEACKFSLQSEWEQCRPCLEDACKNFYSSTCRRGFAAFHTKVGAFFHRISQRFSPRPLAVESGDILVNQEPNSTDLDLDVDRVEESFKVLLRDVGLLVNRSVDLVSSMGDRLDAALQRALLDRDWDQDQDTESTSQSFPPGRDSAFLQGVGLDQVLDSFLDFGRSVVEEFGAVLTQVVDGVQQQDRGVAVSGAEAKSVPRFLQNRKLCRTLRKQTSECWRLQTQCEACQGALLTECPSVRELHVELEEVSQLLDVSRDQFQEVLSIVQRHTDDTVSWLSDVASGLSWLGQAAGNGTAVQNIFRVTKVAPESRGEDESGPETQVEVNILNSPPLVVFVPPELQPQQPAFIQQVVQEAMDKYKEMVRFEDE